MYRLKVQFFGAAGEVGRSCILIESNGSRVLMDAGVKPSGEGSQGNNTFPVIPDDMIKSLDAIVLTHAHLDHAGYLPHIFSTGWKGKVYATKPTMELSNVLVNDYMRISNPSNVTKNGLNALQKGYKLVEYNNEFKVNDMYFRLLPAGHILGSSMVQATDGHNTVLYTGDFNLKVTKLLNPAHSSNLNADTLIMESTYGGEKDVFPTETQILKDMMQSMKETLNNGGKVIIPSFAVGRAQEVLFILDDYIRSGILPKVPIYIDGMIGKAIGIYRHNVIFCREEIQRKILMSEIDPFRSENFFEVKSPGMRNRIMHDKRPCVIVTTSGMLNGGPITKYLTSLAGDEQNKLILVGFQVEGTRGRTLLDGAKELDIDGNKVEIKLQVEMYHLSAHADRSQLTKFVDKINGLSNTFLVHGEQEKIDSLSSALTQAREHRFKTHKPNLGFSMEF